MDQWRTHPQVKMRKYYLMMIMQMSWCLWITLQQIKIPQYITKMIIILILDFLLRESLRYKLHFSFSFHFPTYINVEVVWVIERTIYEQKKKLNIWK